MTLDADGNLYLTGRGVIVFNKSGKQIERIDVPENWTANVSFGGKDKQTIHHREQGPLLDSHEGLKGRTHRSEALLKKE